MTADKGQSALSTFVGELEKHAERLRQYPPISQGEAGIAETIDFLMELCGRHKPESMPLVEPCRYSQEGNHLEHPLELLPEPASLETLVEFRSLPESCGENAPLSDLYKDSQEGNHLEHPVELLPEPASLETLVEFRSIPGLKSYDSAEASLQGNPLVTEEYHGAINSPSSHNLPAVPLMSNLVELQLKSSYSAAPSPEARAPYKGFSAEFSDAFQSSNQVPVEQSHHSKLSDKWAAPCKGSGHQYSQSSAFQSSNQVPIEQSHHSKLSEKWAAPCKESGHQYSQSSAFQSSNQVPTEQSHRSKLSDEWAAPCHSSRSELCSNESKALKTSFPSPHVASPYIRTTLSHYDYYHGLEKTCHHTEAACPSKVPCYRELSPPIYYYYISPPAVECLPTTYYRSEAQTRSEMQTYYRTEPQTYYKTEVQTCYSQYHYYVNAESTSYATLPVCAEQDPPINQR